MAAAWRAAAAVALLVGYALLSNWLMVHAPTEAGTLALLFGPLLAAVAVLGWQRRQAWTLAACAALLVLLVLVVLHGGVADAQHLYVLQHGAVHLALAWSFALTLRGDEKPLISALAERLHRRLGQTFTPALAEYTRGVTKLWTVYFLVMIAVSAAVFVAASWETWSLYCTVLTPLAALVLFVAEYVWRYRRHPEFPRVTMRAAFDAYRAHGRAGNGATP